MSTWVLLRGLMRESRHWGEFPQLFQQATGASHVLTPDFPGNGRLHLQASATSVVEMVNFYRARLRQSGHAPPYRVLALSLGAMAAEAWSEMYPGELERMVLINTSLAPHSPFYQRLRPANYPALLWFMLFGSAEQRESLILDLTSRLASRGACRKEIIERWTAFAREFPVTRANILRQLWAAASYRAVLTAPGLPVLLLAAQQDRLVNVKCSLTLAQRWHCALRVHPAAGHDLPLDDGGWVVQQVSEWLDHINNQPA